MDYNSQCLCLPHSPKFPSQYKITSQDLVYSSCVLDGVGSNWLSRANTSRLRNFARQWLNQQQHEIGYSGSTQTTEMDKQYKTEHFIHTTVFQHTTKQQISFHRLDLFIFWLLLTFLASSFTINISPFPHIKPFSNT